MAYAMTPSDTAIEVMYGALDELVYINDADDRQWARDTVAYMLDALLAARFPTDCTTCGGTGEAADGERAPAGFPCWSCSSLRSALGRGAL